jgi:hypothetical protein
MKKYFSDFQSFQCNQLRWRFRPSIQKEFLREISIHFHRLVSENDFKGNGKGSQITFPYFHPLYCTDPVYIKIYTLRNLNTCIRETLRIKHKDYGLRYARAEAVNLIRARERDVKCPEIYAIGELRNEDFISCNFSKFHILHNFRLFLSYLIFFILWS